MIQVTVFLLGMGGITLISVQNAYWIRNEQTILDNVSWEVRKGEHWAVLGRNGSGKTTLMNLISAYEWPTKGQVSVLGNRYGECDVREIRKQIGLVNPKMDTMLHPRDSVENIVVSGYFATIGIYDKVTSEVREMAENAMAKMGINHLADRPLGVLSQGERKKALIARALINEPKLLILDEPCSGFDMSAREQFLSQLSKLSVIDPELSVIYVTHHIEEILPFIHYALLIRDGKVLSSGKKEEVITSETISDTYKIDAEVIWYHGRPYAQIR
jgi:iron complex transport system ATP-binding protein